MVRKQEEEGGCILVPSPDEALVYIRNVKIGENSWS